MYITFLRSSSNSRLDFCEQAYFLEYVLGLPSEANIAAEKGNIVHKVLEILALQKLNKEEKIRGDDLLGDIAPNTGVEALFERVYEKTVGVSGFKEQYDAKHKKDCWKWLNNVLDFREGLYDPRNQHILAAEKIFNFQIKKPWAKYKYTMPNGEVIDGYFGLKGTIDLIVQEDDKTLGIIDYKTGARKDWNTDTEKDFKYLLDDDQLKLYYYAAHHLYPEYEYIIPTIFYAKDGGPFSLPFDKRQIPDIEDWIRSRFERIRQTTEPKLILFDSRNSWKCRKLCHYGKNKQPGTDDTICMHIHKNTKLYGIQDSFNKFGNTDKLTSYGDGGGRKAKDST